MAKLAEAMAVVERSPRACCKEYDFTVTAEVMKNETAATVREFSFAVNIPGFRPGKVPAGMLRSRYGKELKEELTRRVLSAAYGKIMDDDAADVIGCRPDPEPQIELDAACQFTLKVELAPEFETGDYKNLKIELAKGGVSDGDVEKRVVEYRKNYGDFADVEGAAQAGDMLKVTYTSDFELAADASPSLTRQVKAEDSFLWLNEPEMIPGSVAALTGASAGQKFEVVSAYPADYRESALAGKTVKYNIEVLGVRRRGELTNEQLCEKLRVKTLDELKAQLRKAMEQEVENRYREELTGLVYDKLSETIPQFELPPEALENEINKQLRLLANGKVRSEADAEAFKKDLEAHRAEATEIAKKELRKLFILRKIAQNEKISINREEFDSQLKGMSYYYGYKENELRAMLEKTGGMEELQMDMVKQKVLAFLAEQAAK